MRAFRCSGEAVLLATLCVLLITFAPALLARDGGEGTGCSGTSICDNGCTIRTICGGVGGCDKVPPPNHDCGGCECYTQAPGRCACRLIAN